MFLLFHIMVPLLFVFPFRKLNVKHNIFWLLVGSVISDAIDKTAEFFNIWYGRGVAHTCLFLIITFIILQLIKKEKIKTFSYVIGFSIHIVMDFPLPEFFYPLTDINFIFNFNINFGRIDYFMGLLLSNNMLIITELTGFVFLTFLGFFILIKKHFYNLNEDNQFYIDNVKIKIIETIEEVKEIYD